MLTADLVLEVAVVLTVVVALLAVPVMMRADDKPLAAPRTKKGIRRQRRAQVHPAHAERAHHQLV